jgi:hypothetical protein
MMVAFARFALFASLSLVSASFLWGCGSGSATNNHDAEAGAPRTDSALGTASDLQPSSAYDSSLVMDGSAAMELLHPDADTFLSPDVGALDAESGTARDVPLGDLPARDLPFADAPTTDDVPASGSIDSSGGPDIDTSSLGTGGAAGATDVYIAGYSSASSFIAGYWKNGVATAVTDGTNNAIAYAVYVSGGDVYVAGYEEDGDYYVLPGQSPVKYKVAKVWKNGIPTRLTDGKYNSEAHAVVVSGTDVYVAGLEGTTNYPTGGYNGFHTATVWKNNVGTALSAPSGYGQAYAIAVSGQDVYVAGYQQPDSNSYVAATYWKNGTAVPLTSGASSAEALGIAVGGGNVYVVGYEEPLGGGASAAKVWKNGVATALTGGDQATGIVLGGTDVLVSGSQGYSAMLWQNGQGTRLNAAQGAGVAQALGLAVAGNSIYLCGTYNGKAAYWDSNRDGWRLTDGTEPQSSANGIFVVAH